MALPGMRAREVLGFEAGAVVRMQVFHPAVAQQRFPGPAGVLDAGLVDELRTPGDVVDPQQGGDPVGEAPEVDLALRAQLVGEVALRRQHGLHLATVVARSAAGTIACSPLAIACSRREP